MAETTYFYENSISSPLIIWEDLNNTQVVPNTNHALPSFEVLNNVSDEGAWNILTMDENLDWILSFNEPQNKTPIPASQTFEQTDIAPPSEIFSDSEMESGSETSSDLSNEVDWIQSTQLKNLPQKPRLNSASMYSASEIKSDSNTSNNPVNKINNGSKWITTTQTKNLPPKPRFDSTSTYFDSESSGTESYSGSSDEIEWIPTPKKQINHPRKISSIQNKKRLNQNQNKSKDRKPNVSHWLWELLQNPKNHKIIDFTDEKLGEFRILDQKAIANLWGSRNGKKNLNMSYKDLARTMRYHYKKSKGQELQAVNRHLVYRFSRHFLNARRNEVV